MIKSSKEHKFACRYVVRYVITSIRMQPHRPDRVAHSQTHSMQQPLLLLWQLTVVQDGHTHAAELELGVNAFQKSDLKVCGLTVSIGRSQRPIVCCCAVSAVVLTAIINIKHACDLKLHEGADNGCSLAGCHGVAAYAEPPL